MPTIHGDGTTHLRDAPDRTPRRNRGPAAAAANREALIASARRLFSTQGLRVPLSTIAHDAGVGQGVLYRHFPTRIDLALAVFEENVTRVERAVRDAEENEVPFDAAWRELVDLTIKDVAFVETAVESARDDRIEDVRDRLSVFVTPLLMQAQDQGVVPRSVTEESLFFALRATYGLVITGPIAGRSVAAEVDTLLEALGLPRRTRNGE